MSPATEKEAASEPKQNVVPIAYARKASLTHEEIRMLREIIDHWPELMAEIRTVKHSCPVARNIFRV